jgi:hypothetical protein
MGPKLDEAGQLKLTELKEKAGQIERQLERDVAKVSRAAQQQRFVADDVDDEYDEERDLEITPMVALDATYEDDVDGSDDVIDLGIQIGRMRITERIGGLNRPRISEEVGSFSLAHTMHLRILSCTSHLRKILTETRLKPDSGAVPLLELPHTSMEALLMASPARQSPARVPCQMRAAHSGRYRSS